MRVKNLFLWALYDFANSIAAIVFAFYFPQWLVLDKQVPDIWFNALLAGSTILLLFTAPLIAIIADTTNNRFGLFRILSIATFLCLFGISVITNFFPDSRFQTITASLLFMFATYFYLFSFIFYNSFIIQLADSTRLGFVSGIGQFANWFGQITGLLLTVPFITGKWVLFENTERAQVFLPAVIIFILLALPMLLFFTEKEQPKRTTFALRKEVKDYLDTFYTLLKTPGLGTFLIGYFFYNNAILTISSNFPVYVERVFNVSDQVKAFLVLIILCTAAIGALVSGGVSDRIGFKKSLLTILAGWLILLPLIALQSDFFIFSVLLVITGTLFGASAVISRAMVASLAPGNQLSYTFSYYTITERAASILGPLFWGGMITLLAPYGAFRYRIALLGMLLFIFVGLGFVSKIPKLKKDEFSI